MKAGRRAVVGRKGLFLLVVISAGITLFMGVFQVLAQPFVLSFSDSKTLGIVETVAASGMLVTGVFLGVKGIRRNFVRALSAGLAVSGIGMAMFGVFRNVWLVGAFGFLFFAALPFANNSLDYLARTNIPEEMQGRAWGLIGFISQSGYVIAYGFAGLTADAIGSATGRGVGYGASVTILTSGLCMAVIAVILGRIGRIRKLETESGKSEKEAGQSPDSVVK